MYTCAVGNLFAAVLNSLIKPLQVVSGDFENMLIGQRGRECEYCLCENYILWNRWKILAKTICKEYGLKKKSFLFVFLLSIKLLRVIVQIFL